VGKDAKTAAGVTARGNERRAIFRGDADRRKWLELLGELPARFDLKIHGYVMMPNHYHLIVETGRAGLSRALQWFNVSYSVWFNRRHGRDGHLFQGRFKAVIVDAEEWGLALSRYVHLNPVRIARLGLSKRARAERAAGLSPPSNPEEVRERLAVLRAFPWSSYRAYIGLEQPLEWLEVEVLRRQASPSRREAKTAYRSYVEEAIREGIAESPWEKVQAQLVLGGKSLKDKVQRLLKQGGCAHPGMKKLQGRQFSAVMEVVCELKGEPWGEYRDRRGDWGRDLALWLGRHRCALTLPELGNFVEVPAAAVGVAIGRFARRLDQERALAKLAARATQMLDI
jgi:REP-associated tyrosine transposase